MRYNEFRRLMAPFAVFSINDVRMVEPGFDRRRLHEWHTRGYIRLIAKKYYMFADITIDESVLDLVANKIYAPSYVSLESVLSRHGLLPETVSQITSVCTRKTRSIATDIATFTYRTIAPRLFFGYEIAGKSGTKVACMEKAILDYLYFHPDLRARQDYEALRIDRQELSSRIDQNRFESLLARFDMKALDVRAKKFIKWVRYA